MDEKELFRSFNGITYSDEEVQEYMDLGNLSNEEISNISGAVRTQLGYGNIKKSNEIVLTELEEDEKVEKIVKTRNIRMLKAITISSLFGGTMGASMDYGIFDNMYFTNKKVYFVDTNVINQPLNHKSSDLSDILGIRFTNKAIKIVNDKNGEKSIKLVTDRFKLICIILSALFIGYMTYCKVVNIVPDGLIGMIAFGVIVWTILKCIQDLWLDRVKIVMRDGYVWDILIASYDYKKCRDYLIKLSKKYK